MKLDRSFYTRSDVTVIARALLGKVLYTKFDKVITAGIISETEAYAGVRDKASHAYGGKRTPRTEIMYREGGVAYVYLCYGIHSLFNVVTNVSDIPHAVLVRAVIPFTGETVMQRRRGVKGRGGDAYNGPGKVASALGIHYSHSGLSLMENRIWIEDKGIMIDPDHVRVTPRIGVDYAGKDALLPYRFVLPAKHVSFPE